MQGSFIKISFASMLYATTLPEKFQIATSVVVMFVFITRLKVDIINKYYNRSWLQFIKSFLKTFKIKRNDNV